METSQAESLWSEANRAAHETLLKILNDEGSAVSTGGGEVTLDLKALLSESGGQLGVAGKLASKVPPDAGQLTILKSDQLSAAQDISKLVRHLPIVLTLLALLLYGLAIYLAGPRRRQALRSVGFGFVVAGVLSLLLRAIRREHGDRRPGGQRSGQARGGSRLEHRHLAAGDGRRLGDHLRHPGRHRRLARGTDPHRHEPAS